MDKKFIVDDCGMLIGLCTSPSGVDEQAFFDSYISGNLSSCYKKGREANLNEGNCIDDRLYCPVGYKTFGDNNLMFFSLFDDFSYPNRVFHPFNGNGADASQGYRNYDYQLVVGLNTMPAGEASAGMGLKDRFDRKVIMTYPFVCVTRLKVNPIFLCGNGLYCTELIKRKVYDDCEGLCVALNGLGSDELIVVNFAKSMREITERVFGIRNMQFSDMRSVDGSWFEHVRNNSLACGMDCDIDSAHAFSSSYSVCGYAIDRSAIEASLQDDGCKITFTWDIKPGHIANFTKKLSESGVQPKYWKDRLHVSRTIVSLDLDHKALGSDSAKFFDELDKLRAMDNGKFDIRKLHMDVSVDDKDGLLGENCPVGEVECGKHPSTAKAFGRYEFTPEELSGLRADLDKARISKVIKERVMKMFHNFNDGMQDPAFAVSFLEFRPFLDFLAANVHNYSIGASSMKSDMFHEWLDNSLRDFEQAYFNRFHQSNRMRTMSDFNLEWNGGIQQVISSMDYTYKLLMECCMVRPLSSFMYVSGYERVHVTDHSYRINMQHITYPELFVTTIWKEMFNFVPNPISKKDTEDRLFLRNLSDDVFIERLKARVYNHPRFNPKNESHALLYRNIDKEMMVTFMADSLAFFYGYGGDYDLFRYWYFRYLMQTPMAYGPSGDIDFGRFILFMVRMLFVRMLSGGPEAVEDMRFDVFDPVFGAEWIFFFEEAVAFTRILYDLLEQNDFKKLVNDVADKLLCNTFPNALKWLQDRTEIDDEAVLAKMLRKYLDEESIDNRYSGLFENNEIPVQAFSDDEAGMLIYLFLPAYLRHVRKLDLGGRLCSECSKLLPRDVNGHPVLRQYQDCYSNLPADPLGGFFCIDAASVPRYFSCRSVFYMTLFHQYHKDIMNLIVKD